MPILVVLAAGLRNNANCLPVNTVPQLYTRSLFDGPTYMPPANALVPQVVLVNVGTNDWFCGGFDAASAAVYAQLLQVGRCSVGDSWLERRQL